MIVRPPNDYGRRLVVQGEVRHCRVLLVDDLIVYGETKDEAIEKVEREGGRVTGALVVIAYHLTSSKWAMKR